MTWPKPFQGRSPSTHKAAALIASVQLTLELMPISIAISQEYSISTAPPIPTFRATRATEELQMKRTISRLSKWATSAATLAVSLAFLVSMSLISLYTSFDHMI